MYIILNNIEVYEEQRKSLTVQLNSRPLRIELIRKFVLAQVLFPLGVSFYHRNLFCFLIEKTKMPILAFLCICEKLLYNLCENAFFKKNFEQRLRLT